MFMQIYFVMQDGRITERGRVRRLASLDGWYAQTYQSQQLEMKGEEDGINKNNGLY